MTSPQKEKNLRVLTVLPIIYSLCSHIGSICQNKSPCSSVLSLRCLMISVELFCFISMYLVLVIENIRMALKFGDIHKLTFPYKDMSWSRSGPLAASFTIIKCRLSRKTSSTTPNV